MLLEASDVRASRPSDAGPVPVLEGASLALDRGELVDVTGPSGSGKTTLLLALARLLPQASGRLTLDGADASSIAPELWRTRVALVPQRTVLAPGTVAQNLLAPWRLKVRRGQAPPGDAALRAALDGVGLGDLTPERDIARLSVGQASRVALLRVVLTAPDVLLLDEPDAALDDETAAQVARLTAEFVAGGGAVVRVRHARVDQGASRRLRLDAGVLSEVRDA